MPESNSSSTIQLRPARWSDLPVVGQVAEQAFFDDNMLGDFIHPHRRAYPGDMGLYWTRRCRVHFWDYRWKQVVAVDKGPDGEEKVVGFIQWERFGDGGKALELYWFDPRNLMRPLTSAATRLAAVLWPNRAADPEREDILERAYPFIEDSWSGDRAESWYLETLVVRPAHQGRGVGGKLVRAGLDQFVDRDEAAGAAGVCASVISTRGKEAFYQKCGFEVEDGHIGRGEGNPMAGVDGGRMFWRDARKQI